MNPETFCRIFNSGNVRDRADLFVQHDLKEADVNLLLGFPEEFPIEAIVFAGYLKVKSAIWYFIRRSDGKRLPVGAFRMYADGEKTFKGWFDQCKNKDLARANKKLFLDAFEGCVTPEYMDN